jgi:hypothetical protein
MAASDKVPARREAVNDSRKTALSTLALKLFALQQSLMSGRASLYQ